MEQYSCPQCGQTFTMQYAVVAPHCPVCGSVVENTKTMHQAGTTQSASQTNTPPPPPYGPQQAHNAYGAPSQEPGVFDNGPSGKSRGVAGLLAILLGVLGVHYFYLDKVGAGLVCILLSLTTCGIWPILMLVQGIVMLTMRQDDFERKYVNSPSFMPLF